MIRIGYACINTKLPHPNRTCRLRNATPERILQLAAENLTRLESVLKWNVAHGIELFRISSETIPLGSHEINTARWQTDLKPQLQRIGSFIKRNRLRVSMHPGQFTVLNSSATTIVDHSIAELRYHASFLDTLQLNSNHKIVIHLGGVYGDKSASLRRFVGTFRRLDENIKRRVVIENDERCYSMADVMEVAAKIGAPVVFDVFHHRCKPSLTRQSLRQILRLASSTWKKRDGRPKIHYSNQWRGKPLGTHSSTINLRRFEQFYRHARGLELDIMLEVKDKERSVLNITRALAFSWSRKGVPVAGKEKAREDGDSHLLSCAKASDPGP